MFVGVGASRVRDLFEQAKAHKPCIIFIDEIDAVGRQRFAGVGGGHDEREQTLNQLLVEMDGFEANSGVILIAATNRPDVLDPALLRPGRFDRRIVVDHADLKGRHAILDVHCEGQTDRGRCVHGSARTPHAGLLRRRPRQYVERGRVDGRASESHEHRHGRHGKRHRPRHRRPGAQEPAHRRERKEIIAYHEVGHALLAELLPNADPLHKVSILPRGQALGYTLSLPLEDKYLTSRSELLDDITVLLGGRAAEELIFDEITTGAQNDLQRATEHRARHDHGIRHERASRPARPWQGPRRQVFLGRDMMEGHDYSEETAQRIDSEVQSIVDQCYTRAKEILRNHASPSRKIVTELLEKESLTCEEVRPILYRDKQPTPAEVPATV